MTAKLNSILVFILFFALKSSAQENEFINTISLSGEQFPQRELASTIKDENNNIWVLATNELCRINGNDVDCFPIPVRETNELFLIGNRYIIIHNSIGLQCAYFDLKEYKMYNFLINKTTKLFKNLTKSSDLWFYDNGEVWKYNFDDQKIEFVKKIIFPTKNMKYQLYKSSSNDLILIEEGYISINDKKLEVEKSNSFTFQQLFETQENFIYNDGKQISKLDKKTYSKAILYSDDLICKKLWQDETNHFVLGLNKEGICRVMNHLLFYNEDWLPIDAPNITNITKSGFGSNIYSKNFLKEINVAAWNGFYQFASIKPLAKIKLYNDLKGNTFGHITRGMTTDEQGNIYSISEEENIFKEDVNGKIDTIPINVLIKGKIKPHTFGRNICFDEVSKNIYGICGEYAIHDGTIFTYSPSSKKVDHILSLPHRFYCMIKDKRKLIIASAKEYIFVYDLDQKRMDTLHKMINTNLHVRSLYIYGDLLYIGCKEGVYTLNLKNNVEQLIEPLSGIQANDIIIRNDTLYLSTLNGVIVSSNKGKILKTFNTKNGLPNDDAKKVMFINNDEALIPTEKGLARINFKNGLIYKYDARTHLLSSDENNTFGQYTYQDKVYLGTVNGYHILNREDLNRSHEILPFLSKISKFTN
ncbi:MAG: hypothetical protein RLZZ546_2482, partial [Bacteroidota bacterium]